MLGREGRIYSLVGCVVFAGWISVGYAIFRSLNSPTSWFFLAAFGGFGLVAFILYLGVAREEFSGLKNERLAVGFFLLILGFFVIVANQIALPWLASRGFIIEPWLKKCAEAVIIWGVSVMITGFWLLLAPQKNKFVSS